MLIEKYKPVRSRKLLDAAENERCIRCGCQDGTVVAAHYQGFGSNRLGKGRGQKPDDTATAELCSWCCKPSTGGGTGAISGGRHDSY